MSDADSLNIPQKPVLEEMPHDQVRRRLTIAAFVFLATSGSLMLCVGLWSDPLAKRVNELSGVLNAVYVVMGGVVGAYFGVGSWERVNRIKAG